MDELTRQLRDLGEAAEHDTPSISVEDVHRRATAGNEPTDIGSVQPTSPVVHRRRRLSPKALIAAAIALLALGASVTVLGDRDNDNPVQVTSAIQTATEPPVTPDDNGWEELRQCESSGRYDTDTGNGFYGAYQFTLPAFRGTAEQIGLTAYAAVNPATAPPHVQDAVAKALYLDQGRDLWPICGQSLRGPMITPVVPQWLDSAAEPAYGTVVYVSPYLSPETLDDIGDQLAALAKPYSTARFQLVDQAARLVEFQATYGDNPDALRSVRESDLSPRFEIAAPLPAVALAQIRELDEVFDAFDTTPFERRGLLRLSIPAIGLETPVYASASISNLDRGPAVMVNDSGVLAIAGYGSVDGSVFHLLDQLRDGDLIVVSTLFDEGGTPFELVRQFAVDLGSGDQRPAVFDLDEALLWRNTDGQTLTLVADVEGEPEQRLVVRTEAIAPHAGNYPVAAED